MVDSKWREQSAPFVSRTQIIVASIKSQQPGCSSTGLTHHANAQKCLHDKLLIIFRFDKGFHHPDYQKYLYYLSFPYVIFLFYTSKTDLVFH